MQGTRKTIHLKKAHEGSLHRDWNVPAGQPIPAAQLEEALHSTDSAERKRAPFAENAGHFQPPNRDR